MPWSHAAGSLSSDWGCINVGESASDRAKIYFYGMQRKTNTTEAVLLLSAALSE